MRRVSRDTLFYCLSLAPMSELSIDLLAIAIFIITMVALTSPLTGISPLLPTGVTVLALALFGLDNAYGEGRLGNWIQSFFPRADQNRVLYHEAGHFLAAHLLGVKILRYDLSSQAGVEVDMSGKISDLSLCTIWMAGIAAEEFIFQSADGGQDDLLKLRQAIAKLENPPLEERWAKIRARNLIRVNSEAFGALVAKMEENAPVADCMAVVDSLAVKSEF